MPVLNGNIHPSTPLYDKCPFSMGTYTHPHLYLIRACSQWKHTSIHSSVWSVAVLNGNIHPFAPLAGKCLFLVKAYTNTNYFKRCCEEETKLSTQSHTKMAASTASPERVLLLYFTIFNLYCALFSFVMFRYTRMNLKREAAERY